MIKRLSLAESMRQAAQASALPPLPVVTSTSASSRAVSKEAALRPSDVFHAATRAGKKKVTAPLTPEDHKRLRHLALDRDMTTEALLVEAINDLFAKHATTGTGKESRSR